MRARAVSRCIQSTETLSLMLTTNSCAITRRIDSPITCLALSFSARASQDAMAGFFAPRSCCPNILGKLDQFFDDQRRGTFVAMNVLSARIA